jgi:hydroxymethylpyrimidine kinase / phosphomethylpyrimidine kinase / thiamine-phosphate diphosphorylase
MFSESGKPFSVMAIGGSDPIGGSGVTLDARVIAGLGCHPFTVISSTIAQNSSRVISAEAVSPKIFAQQIEAIFEVTTPDLIKIGVLHTTEQVNILCRMLSIFDGPIIYDPVLATSSGFCFGGRDFLVAIRAKLLPLLSLITPNIPEAKSLLELEANEFLGHEVNAMQTAARALKNMGSRHVLLKGGHGTDDAQAADFWDGEDQTFWLIQERLPWSMRGTGCALASAIAGYACQTRDLAEAVVLANAYVHAAIRTTRQIDENDGGKSSRFFHMSQELGVQASDYPTLCNKPRVPNVKLNFAPCDTTKMAVYPIVDRAKLIEELAQEGVQTIQLRIKDLAGAALIEELRRGQVYAQAYGVQLFINDHWREAIELNAFGVHLGQEDIEGADLRLIADCGLRLGISTHSYVELARVKCINPSYVAVGPIFPTTCKSMRFSPHGMDGITAWRRFWDGPLIAIGGLKLKHVREAMQRGATGVAVISDIVHHPQMRQQARLWLEASKGIG